MNKIWLVKYSGDKDYGQAQGWVVRAHNPIEAKALIYASLAEYRASEYSDDIADWDIVLIPQNSESVIVLVDHAPS